MEMGRTPSASKAVVRNECAKRGLSVSGSTKQMMKRLEKNAPNKYYECKKKIKKVANKCESKKKKNKDSSSKVTIACGVSLTPSTASKKRSVINSAITTSALKSTRETPLRSNYQAQEYVKEYCSGNVINATPQWRIGGKSNEVKYMVPKWCNTKGGMRIRWVLDDESLYHN